MCTYQKYGAGTSDVRGDMKRLGYTDKSAFNKDVARYQDLYPAMSPRYSLGSKTMYGDFGDFGRQAERKKHFEDWMMESGTGRNRNRNKANVTTRRSSGNLRINT